MKFCLLFSLSSCARYCLLIGSQLTTWSQGNLHYIRSHFFQLDREFFCLLPSLARLYSAAASPSERLRSDGSLAIIQETGIFYFCCYFVFAKNNSRWNYIGIYSSSLHKCRNFALSLPVPGRNSEHFHKFWQIRRIQKAAILRKHISLNDGELLLIVAMKANKPFFGLFSCIFSHFLHIYWKLFCRLMTNIR